MIDNTLLMGVDIFTIVLGYLLVAFTKVQHMYILWSSNSSPKYTVDRDICICPLKDTSTFQQHCWSNQKLKQPKCDSIVNEWINSCYGLNACVPPKFICSNSIQIQILTPNVMVVEGVAFEKWLGHEGKTLVKEICCFIKKNLPCEGAGSLRPRIGPSPEHAVTLILDFHPPKL